MRFSIIVPVYNVEKYIEKCILSILSQSFQDFELIMVNDGTKDNSAQVAREILYDTNANWHIIDKENGGQGSARNLGIRNAVGEYLIFVDSDDYIASNMLEVIDRAIRDSNAEIICFNSIMVNEKAQVIKKYDMCNSANGIYSILSHPAMLLNAPAIWNKACKRDFFIQTGCFFVEGIIYEDTVVSRALMCEAKQVVFLDEYLYYYVQRTSSTMNQKKRQGGHKRIMDVLKANEALLQWFKDKDLFEKYYFELEAIAFNTVFLYALNLLNMNDKDDERQRILARFIFDNYEKFEQNPYLSDEDKKRIRLLKDFRFDKYYRHYGRILKVKTAVEHIFMKIQLFQK